MYIIILAENHYIRIKQFYEDKKSKTSLFRLIITESNTRLLCKMPTQLNKVSTQKNSNIFSSKPSINIIHPKRNCKTEK